MELKDFIAETLVQITQGVNEAKEKLIGQDVIINPGKTFFSKDGAWIGKQQENGPVLRRVQDVEMKICVSSSEEVFGDGSAKVHLGVLSADAELKEKGMASNENFIRFSIPVSFPITEITIEGNSIKW